MSRLFLSHSSHDSEFVIQVAGYLQKCCESLFYYEEHQSASIEWRKLVEQEIEKCDCMVVFYGPKTDASEPQGKEVGLAAHLSKRIIPVLFSDYGSDYPRGLTVKVDSIKLTIPERTSQNAARAAHRIAQMLELEWRSVDGLPANLHLFDYEKDIINFFSRKEKLGNSIYEPAPEIQADEKASAEIADIREALLQGCPASWPEIEAIGHAETDNLLPEATIGKHRKDTARVVTSALHTVPDSLARRFTLLEAGPRSHLYYPRESTLNVGVMVAGGIAPGINAVIDGITQRHWLYAHKHGYAKPNRLCIYGLLNGFQAFEDFERSHKLLTITREQHGKSQRGLETPEHAHEGGSILGTSRLEDLSNEHTRTAALRNIHDVARARKLDILYIIGGDGSMKAAHAIWSYCKEQNYPLSVVTVPKTMDNDILWVWQSFGFMSAVEKAREFIENMHTEVASNPRLGIVQLFGSDSGFVVSHAVLAASTKYCYLALIPEINFSLRATAEYLSKRIEDDAEQDNCHIPRGLVVMAESAIPEDAELFAGTRENSTPKYDVGLSAEEKQAVWTYLERKAQKMRMSGQTGDDLRSASLKIVSRGLAQLLPQRRKGDVDWRKLRVVCNEPRHLVRAIPPSCQDIISGRRLGSLAVDNALAGYTDFMISQWLTEFVMVPLRLATLGRKRIPEEGIFWKSVVAKTGQPGLSENRN